MGTGRLSFLISIIRSEDFFPKLLLATFHMFHFHVVRNLASKMSEASNNSILSQQRASLPSRNMRNP
jgi:hypothetical protein